MVITWLTAFLDHPRDVHEASAAFWCALTGSTLSPARGEHGQFATLVPPDGDAYLRVQAIDDGPPSAHLDLHVPDLRAATAEATAEGATQLADQGDVVILRSPAGLVFCLVDDGGEQIRPTPLRWPDDTTSLLDQICLDVPATDFDDELSWWSALTEWPQHSGAHPEFGYLERPPQLPLRLLFQRTDAPGTHLDFACSDRDFEVARHVSLGAEPEHHLPGWDVLRDPAGRRYCITDRTP